MVISRSNVMSGSSLTQSTGESELKTEIKLTIEFELLVFWPTDFWNYSACRFQIDYTKFFEITFEISKLQRKVCVSKLLIHLTFNFSTYSIMLRSMSTSSPVQSGIFFFLFRRLLEWQVISCLQTMLSTIKGCRKVPSNSCTKIVSGPTYLWTPLCCVLSCRISISKVFLKTKKKGTKMKTFFSSYLIGNII